MRPPTIYQAFTALQPAIVLEGTAERIVQQFLDWIVNLGGEDDVTSENIQHKPTLEKMMLVFHDEREKVGETIPLDSPSDFLIGLMIYEHLYLWVKPQVKMRKDTTP